MELLIFCIIQRPVKWSFFSRRHILSIAIAIVSHILSSPSLQFHAPQPHSRQSSLLWVATSLNNCEKQRITIQMQYFPFTLLLGRSGVWDGKISSWWAPLDELTMEKMQSISLWNWNYLVLRPSAKLPRELMEWQRTRRDEGMEWNNQ